MYRAVKMDVPDEPYSVPLSEAKVVRSGEQVTCVAWGAMLYEAFAAAEEVAKQGIDVEVIDLRTLWPVDIETIVASVQKTGRFVVAHEAPQTCGFGSELGHSVDDGDRVHFDFGTLREFAHARRLQGNAKPL